IPNSEVKRKRADGSVHPACESRSSPGSLPKTPQPRLRGLSLWARVSASRACAAACLARSPALGYLGRLSKHPVMSMRRAPCFLVSVVCLLGMGVTANAAELARVDVQGATGMCKASTFAFSQVTRYRPLAVANESEGPIYVSCNWQGDDKVDSVRGAKVLSVAISNYDAADQDVTCTLVNGHQTGGMQFAVYVPKTVSIPAGGFAEITWVPGEVSNSKPSGIDRPSLSCVLPPQTALQHTRREYNEDVGA